MDKIEMMNISRALKLLDASGCSYAILDRFGTQYGELTLNVKKKRKKGMYKWGELTNYVRSYMKDMTVGVVVHIPAGDYSLEKVQSVASSFFTRTYGKDAHTTTINRDTGMVEIVRIE